MKINILFIACCLLTSMLSQRVLAWGQTGHRVTGEIAEHYLDPIAAAYVKQILVNESLAEASTWPDEMRSNPSTFWQKEAGPYHYVTVPENKVYKEVGAPPEGDAISALEKFKNVLLNPISSVQDKQLALRFIVHLIGDLHQPLHAGNGTDRGGNDLKVQFMWADSNLHRVWDSGLIDHQNLSYTEWSNQLEAKLDADTVAKWHSTNPLVWVAESTQLRDTLYPEDANNMSWQYIYDFTPVVKQRLSQGGVRIALYLNELFGELAKNKD